jgi:hypothetical protein
MQIILHGSLSERQGVDESAVTNTESFKEHPKGMLS